MDAIGSRTGWLRGIALASQSRELSPHHRFAQWVPRETHHGLSILSILAKIAKPGEPVPTSRSLKATCLSWVAKAGVSPPLRKLLGYHVDATELSVNTCSRDLLAPPLRELVRVLSLIALGAFFPDTTRSGYFAFNDPGTHDGNHDGNDAAPAVLPQPPSASVSADTTAVTAESALGPTSPQSPRTSDSTRPL